MPLSAYDELVAMRGLNNEMRNRRLHLYSKERMFDVKRVFGKKFKDAFNEKKKRDKRRKLNMRIYPSCECLQCTEREMYSESRYAFQRKRKRDVDRDRQAEQCIVKMQKMLNDDYDEYDWDIRHM